MNITKLPALSNLPMYVPLCKDLCTEHFQAGFGSKFVDRVYQYMNQEKLNFYDEKTLKKNIGTQKTYYIWQEEGGKGVSQIHKKKIVSVGLFSMFCHPLVIFGFRK